MKVLLEIEDSKAIHLLEVLKGLSYVKIHLLTDEKENSDWWDTLSDKEKETIEKGLKNLETSKVAPQEDVKTRTI